MQMESVDERNGRALPFVANGSVAFADEMASREDHRRLANGDQFDLIARGALNAPVSRN